MVRLKLKVQLYCGENIAMGPGKADLLEAIEEAGSISGAARALGMSYRRAWLLVDMMNRCFAEDLVISVAGGGAKSGAQMSEAGARALAAFRKLETGLGSAADGDALADLEAMICAPQEE